MLLAGAFAYKLKKPVDLGFLDFSTLALRRRFCEEELRLNRRFAESLYLDVVPVTTTAGSARIGGSGEIVEYAVRMRRFPSEMQLDRLLAAGRLEPAELAGFGAALADLHAGLPRCAASSRLGTPAAVWGPVRENFLQIRGSGLASQRPDVVDAIEAWSHARYAELARTIEQRHADGFVRECHGDLHLSNLVRLDDGIHAFDCIEFSEALRWIDPISDAAFLVMDCGVRGRADLAYAFLDRYLERSGDYAGGALLGFHLVYRSMVRAKVAALQAKGPGEPKLCRRFDAHLDFARERALRFRPAMILMCGLSGSGKSWLAERLVPLVPGVRLRSDVERKRLADLAPLARTHAGVAAGLYAADRSDALYRHLLESAEALVRGGERSIVDATFLTASRRAPFLASAARSGVACVIVHCVAPHETLARRIEQRNEGQRDPSDATVEVLEAQRARYEPPSDSEAATVVTLDTGQPFDAAELARRIRASIDAAP